MYFQNSSADHPTLTLAFTLIILIINPQSFQYSKKHFATIASSVLTLSTKVSADCYGGGATRNQAGMEQLTADDYSALRFFARQLQLAHAGTARRPITA